MKLILASGSERRKELLSWLEIPFEVIESGIDETVYPDEEPSELVARLAVAKAHEVAKQWTVDSGQLAENDGIIVIGADTVVTVDDLIIGKPNNRKHAEEIIGKLSGKTHEVWTGVCVVDPLTGERKVETEVTRVTIRQISDKELKKYLDSNEWVGKAGGYAIQGKMGQYITDLAGSYTNVVGLPLLVLQDLLESLGTVVEVEVREEIRKRTGRES